MWQYVKSHGSYPTTCPCKSDRGNYHEATYQASSASAQAKRRKTASHLRGVNVVGVANNWTLIEMSGPIELPPELQRVADLLSEQPPEVRDLFRYALVLALIDDEKAWVTGTRLIDNREYLTVRSVAGDVFEIIRPPISEEEESALMARVRTIVEEESEDGR